LKSPPPNDPLASLTPKQIWHDCIWISDETSETKLMLLCVGRFFDNDGRSSSMSYAQIRSDCSLSERFVKYGAKQARNRWLKIEIGKGKLTPNGPQNLYHAICPSELVEELRQRRSKGLAVPYDAKLAAVAGLMPDGVHTMHPNGSRGVHQEHPDGVHGMHGVHATTDRGAPGAHLLTKDTPNSRGDANDASPDTGPSRKRGTRLTTDWSLPEEWREWTLSEFRVTDRQIKLEADKFADHWHSKPGKDGTKLDWHATWRNWCRTAFNRLHAPGGQSDPNNDLDPRARAEALRRLRAI
jgi:hypothetical protein